MAQAEQGASCSTDVSSLLASVLEPLVSRGFIGASEIGQIALLSRSMQQATLEDRIWIPLCHRVYPNTNSLPSDFTRTKGYRWLYRYWSSPIVKKHRPLPPLPPPACREDQLTFHVIAKHKGDVFFTKAFKASDMSENILSGMTTLKLESPLIVGEAYWGLSDFERQGLWIAGSANVDGGLRVRYKNDVYKKDAFNAWKLDISIHMYRENDSTLCCIFRSNERCLDEGNRDVYVCPVAGFTERITDETKFDFDKKQTLGSISFLKPKRGNGMLCLKRSPVASEILFRLNYPVFFGVDLKLSVIRSGHVAITELDILALKDVPNPNGAFISFNSEKEEPKNGVTLLHVLSEVYE